MIAAAADIIVGSSGRATAAAPGCRRRRWCSRWSSRPHTCSSVRCGSIRSRRATGSPSQLPDSAGLLPNQDVTLRGVPIGRVERLDITPDGVNAIVDVDSTVPIPVSSDVRVSGLSPAGEQYIDFAADSDAGPYLSDGAVIAQGKATVPVSLAELLAHADGALAQVDTAKLELIKRELSLSDAGTAEARRHRRRRHLPAVDAGFGATGDHQCAEDQPDRAHDGRGQERRNRGRLGQSELDLRRRRPDARRLPPVHRRRRRAP